MGVKKRADGRTNQPTNEQGFSRSRIIIIYHYKGSVFVDAVNNNWNFRNKIKFNHFSAKQNSPDISYMIYAHCLLTWKRDILQFCIFPEPKVMKSSNKIPLQRILGILQDLENLWTMSIFWFHFLSLLFATWNSTHRQAKLFDKFQKRSNEAFWPFFYLLTTFP